MPLVAHDVCVGSGSPLTETGFSTVVSDLDIDRPTLWSLIAVETRGFGYLANRALKVLFERHIFHRRTAGRFSATHPDISQPRRGGYTGGVAEYPRVQKAIDLEPVAALESASWGLGQIMGFHAQTLGYPGALDMVCAFTASEDAQLDAVARFARATPRLAQALQRKDWARVALCYNGSRYRENRYDERLEQFHDLYAFRGEPDLEVRAAQVRLTYLGFDPRGVDGLLGPGTRRAVAAFRRAHDLPDGDALDTLTLEALVRAAGA